MVASESGATPARKRTRRPREQREREILAAARRVFGERGFASGSVAEIAARAGVVEGTVYSYFDTKRSLLLRVVTDFYETLIRDVAVGLRAIRGAESRLRFLIARHVAVFVEDLGMCRLVLSEIRPDPALYGDAVEDLNRRYTSLAVEVIEAGMAAGELRADLPPSLLRDLLYGGLEHALWRHVFSGADIDAPALAEALADALLGGALPRETAGESTALRIERAVTALERHAEVSA